MRIASHGEIVEINHGGATALRVDLAKPRIAADHLRHLNVDQVRRIHRL